MLITEITVTGLFGMFDHTVSLNKDDRITIVYGPNGFGKTYLLNLVNDLFNLRFDHIGDVPFDSLMVRLDDRRVITLIRTEADTPGIASITVTSGDGNVQHLDPEGFATLFADSVSVRFINTERLMLFSDTQPDRPMISRCAHTIRDHAGSDDTATREKLDTLVRIINSRFQHKTMSVDAENGFTFKTSANRTLLPEQLSSGEQHAVIMLTELLFNVRPDTLILIDEPELSLHIFWQQQFIRDIGEVIRFGAFDVLIATHSPQIIHDRWDLTVELKGPDA